MLSERWNLSNLKLYFNQLFVFDTREARKFKYFLNVRRSYSNKYRGSKFRAYHFFHDVIVIVIMANETSGLRWSVDYITLRQNLFKSNRGSC